MIVTVLSGVLTANGAPVDATSGVALPTPDRQRTDRGMLLLNGTNTGVGSLTGKLWVYNAGAALWYPAGTDPTSSLKGVINGGIALGETTSDVIRHTEEVRALLFFTRVFFEIVAAANLATLVVKLDCLKYEGN